MDPTTTLSQLRYAIHEKQFARAVELLTAYYQWRIKGGFAPNAWGDARADMLSIQLQDALEAL